MSALRSHAFNLLFYGLTTLLCVGLLWTLALPRAVMMAVIRQYLKDDRPGWSGWCSASTTR